MAGRRSLTRKEIQAEAELLERAVASAQGGALAETLTAWRPGTTRNPGRDARAWFVWHRHLVAAHARRTHADAPAKAGADLAALAALSSAPLTRPSRVPRADGTARYLTVYPKSFVVLTHLYAHDLAIARLQPAVSALYEHPDFDPALLRRLLAALADEQLRCAWIVMTEGPGMPWDPDGPPPETLPDWVTALHPVEVHQLLEMNLEVNFLRLAALRQLITPDPAPAEARPYWSPFFASAGEALGLAPRVLMRDHALEAVLTQVQLLADARRREAADATARREAED